MRVESLATLGFRNLGAAELALGAGVTLLHGPNGAGKTNLLEALYLALAGRSCRTRADREMIAFGEPLARAEAVVEAEGERRRFLCAVDRSDGRRHQVNGSPATADATALRPAMAVFMPDRLTLIKGPPAARRAHLDGFVAALHPARAEARRRYSRALAQRNALVGRIRAGAATATSLDAWDAELATAGIELIETRAAAAAMLAPAFAAGRGRAWPRRGRRARLPTPKPGGRRRRAPVGAGRAPGIRHRAGLQRPRPAPRRAGDLGRRARRAPLRVAGTAADRAARAALRRARRAGRRRAHAPAAAARRRHLGARPRAPRAPLRPPGRRRRPGADHRDRGRAPPGGVPAGRARGPRWRRDPAACPAARRRREATRRQKPRPGRAPSAGRRARRRCAQRLRR